MTTDREEARLSELRRLADEFSVAYADRAHLDEFKKSKLAILMKRAEAEGHKTTAAQEREARADTEYVELLSNLRTATEISERLRWQLEIAKLGVAVWQTKQANERAERRGYGA